MFKQYLSLLALICCFSLSAQNESDSVPTTIPKIFLICEYCDKDYYKNEIGYLYFVRDQRLADIVVLFRNIETGSGGREITLEFKGKGTYEGISIQETYHTQPNMSDSDIRQGLLNCLKRGALPFLLRSPLANQIQYEVAGLNKEQPADSIRDKWNLWIFNVDGSMYGNGQEYTNSFSFNGSFSANRTSEKNLFEAGVWFNNNQAVYKIEGQDPIRSNILNWGVYNQDAISIGKHWALGYNTGLYSSTVSNMQTNTDLTPQIEYNVFPYSEATVRQLRFNYRIGVRQVNYVSPTYRNQLSDWFLTERFSARYRLVKNWGNIGMGIGLDHVYDTEHFYSIDFSPSISWNITKGLNFNISGSYSIVRDQYFLRADEVSSEEILTGQAQLKSAYNYFLYIGLNYSFGSIYNNVVNVRFQGI